MRCARSAILSSSVAHRGPPVTSVLRTLRCHQPAQAPPEESATPSTHGKHNGRVQNRVDKQGGLGQIGRKGLTAIAP